MTTETDRQRACVQQWMRAFLEPNQITEIRLLGPIGSKSFDVGTHFDEMISFILNANGNHKGVYFTPNPLRHMVGSGKNGNHTDCDIVKRNWLLIDIDANREKNTNATDEELDDSRKVAESIFETLRALKFGGLIYGTSGNGFHVCAPVNLPNTDTATQKHRQLLHALDERFSSGKAKVDKSTFNPSRIWKLPGTLAMKGPHTVDRPHRYARLIDVPNDARSYADKNTQLLDTLIANWTPKVAQIFDDDRNAVVRRAIKYLEKEPPAVEGDNGSDRCYHVAGVCYDGFALNEEECLAAMQAWNLRCQPPWSEKELRHKIDSVKAKGGQRGKMLDRPYEAPAEPVEVDTSTPIIVRANSIKPKVVQWLWPDRIPLGKLTTFAGVGGLGKTFCLLDIAARISRGSEWPHTAGECAVRGQTIFISGEDDPDDTLVPRLEGMDADLSQIVFLRSDVADQFTLKDLTTLEKALEQAGPDVRFVAIDPPTCFLGGADDHKNSELRALLSPLKTFAAKHNVSIIFNTHLNKGAGQVDAMMRVMGSVAWVNAVRAAHLFARDPDESEKRVFACMKNNLGPETKALTYKIAVEDARPRIVWLDEVETTANDAINNKPHKSRKEEASEWLIEQFRERREWPSNDLFAAAKQEGLSRDAVYEAKAKLNLPKARKVTQSNGDVVWVWWVPEDWSELKVSDEEGF